MGFARGEHSFDFVVGVLLGRSAYCRLEMLAIIGGVIPAQDIRSGLLE
jgi:hypothetical protein